MATSNYTLGDIQDLVLDRLENNSIMYPAATVLTPLINEAIRVSNMMCGWFQSTERVLSVANQLVYAVPSSLVYPQRVQFEGIQLDPTPLTRIGQDYRNWITDTSNNLGAVARWVPIGITQFAIHPMDSSGGQDIEVTGVAEPTTLVSSTDNIPLEDQWATVVVEYAASRAVLPSGGKPFADASQLYTTSFIKSMKSMTNLRKLQFPRYFLLRGAPVVEASQE